MPPVNFPELLFGSMLHDSSTIAASGGDVTTWANKMDTNVKMHGALTSRVPEDRSTV